MASVNPITARAMAHAQTSTTNRRALLGGLAVAPLAAQAEPAAHPDAALLALEERRAAAEALYEDVHQRAIDLEDAGEPEPPEALFFRPSDYKLRLETFANFSGQGQLWYYPACRPEKGQTRWPYLRDEQCQALRPASEPRQKRIAEILQAYDIYNSEVAEAKKTSGFTALYALAQKLGGDLKEIENVIFATPALTLDGLAIKAKVVQRNIDAECDVYDEAVAVVQEIVRMAETSEIGRMRFRDMAMVTA